MGHIRLEGAIDLHCHYGPDFILRKHLPKHQHSVTALQAAQEAADAGMAALVLKSHDFPTAALAYTIGQTVSGVKTFGGITLDHQVGGLNPWAVEHALRLGAKIVWLPTIASYQDHLNGLGPMLGYAGEGIHTLDEDGNLLPVVHEILNLVAEHDAVIATGHTTAQEHFAVAKAFAHRGKVIATHVCEQLAGPRLDKAQCCQLAEMGVYLEITAQLCVHHAGTTPKPVSEIAQLIHAAGPAQCVLATDYGYTTELPNPAQGLKDYIDDLWTAGVSEQELRTMVCDNSARLLSM